MTSLQNFIKVLNVKRTLAVSVFFVCVIFGVCVIAYFPKKFTWIKTDGSGDYISGTYYGFGITNEENIGGKVILSISEPLSHHYPELSLESGTFQLLLDNKQIGENRSRNCTFIWYDKEKRTRAQGECIIKYNKGLVPFVNSYTSFEVLSVNSGTYYKTDGFVGSLVKEGEGDETFGDMQGMPIVNNKIIEGVIVQ